MRAGGWPTGIEQLILEQKRMASLVFPPWEGSLGSIRCGGVFICYERGKREAGKRGDRGWAAFVLIFPDGKTQSFCVEGRTPFDYVPGCLALREGPLLEEALLGLGSLPDLLFVNATARDHPYRAGLALHLGFKLDIPSIGITRKPLLAEGTLPGNKRGETSELRIGNQAVGFWLRTQDNKAPLVVHPGYRIDFEKAKEIALFYTERYRTPQPLRLARQLSRLLRAGMIRPSV
ncbi:endonuclease V [Candidatus Methylacidiphilum infernorum]|uniref:Deoxyinosine 3'endonuclease/endonuclease V n=1 Tax=Methylacidiphilum infernorum (isolate V4) TaxID=481448 RepID=B3DWG0_METI4|nr:endonuclease V [Candidatus Methylacidiphilum infernorum]ACD83663.1 Deoxyinosine 3'endonuclease/endonuclease V [Methylacidiphilum infernorum V4]